MRTMPEEGVGASRCSVPRHACQAASCLMDSCQIIVAIRGTIGRGSGAFSRVTVGSAVRHACNMTAHPARCCDLVTALRYVFSKGVSG